jgi:6-phosphogluconolactonase (cycloisomerase 2 family)
MSGRFSIWLRIALVVVAVLSALNAPSAQAAPAGVTLTVTTLLDKMDANDAKCSLREAMMRAVSNSNNNSIANDCPQAPSGNATIKFGVSGTIVISNSVDGGQLPNIVNTVTIIGPITIDASKADQIPFDVESNGRLNLVNMTIKNAKYTALDSRGEINIASVTFQNNGAGGAGGGAIRNDGVAVIAGSKFINNNAVGVGMDGGAIRSTWSLKVAGSAFTGNTADINGGAIALKAGRMEIADTTFTGNVVKGTLFASALGEGGGAIATSAVANTYPMTISRSTFQGNYATEGVGGAIFHNADVPLLIVDSSFQGNGVGKGSNLGSGGAIRNVREMIIKRSVFIANSAIGDGGAISNDYNANLTLRLVSFTGNNASQKGGAIANLDGGNSSALISAIGVAVNGNVASDKGGGIYNHDSKYDKAEFRLSVWSGNLPQNCRDQNSLDDKLPFGAIPPIDSKGQNSFSDDTCEDGDPDPTDQQNPDAKLDPPALNGGAVPGMLTQKPRSDSPLIDQIAPVDFPTGDPDVGNQDIRGMPRPMNGDGIGLPLFDIGPFELDDATPKFSSLPSAPGPIAFGTLQTGTTLTRTDALKIFNGGDGFLTISSPAFGGANPSDFKAGALPAPINSGSSSQFAISCTPGANGARTATLSINTNDPNHAQVVYNLTCTGQAAAAAGYGSTKQPPGPIEESTVVGTPDPFYLNVSETGNAQLTLSSPALVANPPGSIVLNTAFPVNIPNGNPAVNIQFTCAAESIGTKTATFTFNTNDPAHSTVSYNLICTVNKPVDAFFADTSNTNVGLAGVAGPYGIAISPDGKHAYVVDNGDSKLVVYRVMDNNLLTFIGSYASSALPASQRFDSPYQVAVSADGANVYVTGLASDSIAMFKRDADTGLLTHQSTVRQGQGYNCTLSVPPDFLNCSNTVTGLDGAYGIAISADGQTIYVSSIYSDSVVAFRRDVSTGELTSVPYGPNFVQQYTNASLNAAYGMAVSPDGNNLYVTGYVSDALLTLKREPSTGVLSTVQVLTPSVASGLNGVFRVIISPDGNFVYTAAYDSDSVCSFMRNTVDGTLTSIGCYANSTYLDAASDVALMPDGKHLLASAYNSDGLVVFRRDTQTGAISFRESITRSPSTTLPRLGGARGVVANPNGKALYATGHDDDYVVSILVANPLPVLTTLTPAAREAGSGSFILTVNGADFVSDSVVRVNGVDRTTTFLNETQLSAELLAGDVSAAGTKQITVRSPSPGGGTSNVLTLTVLAPGALIIPSLSQMNVLGAVAGGGAVTVEVQGADFVAGAKGLWNGAIRPTVFISSGLLLVQLTAADMAQPGLGALSIQNTNVLARSPEATTNSSLLTIKVVNPNQNPAPGIAQISPSWINAAGSAVQVEVIITGTGFVQGARAYWNGEERTTQLINSTRIKMIVSAADLMLPGVGSVQVINPAPGGGESNVKTLTILGPLAQYKVSLPLVRRS